MTRILDHPTSVKEQIIQEEPTKIATGIADFRAKQVYSVFDIGTITPVVPLDNSTITLMGGFNFELLKEKGIESHYIGLVDKDGRQISAKDAIAKGISPNIMRIKYANRIDPVHRDGKWDYSMFVNPDINNYVQPIEFITRNGLPPESSVWKRIKRGKVTLEDFGLPSTFKPGDEIPPELVPLLDYSTKFEPDDRYLRPEEARRLMSMAPDRFATLGDKSKRTSNLFTEYAESRGFKRDDGKVEYIVIDGSRDDLGDAVCTWHEDRLKRGVGISKQRIRDKETKVNPKWYAEIQRAKEQAKDQGAADFRKLMDPNIRHDDLPAEFIHRINRLFQAATNQWVAARVYDPYPGKSDSLSDTLDRAVEDFQKVAK